MRQKTGPRRGAALAALGAALVFLPACGPGGDESGAPAETAAASAARIYQVRGVIRGLPDPETGAGRLEIRHEAIPDLVGQSGEVEGMAAMTMPFPVDAAVDLAGFAVGDVVGFELTVDWEADRPVAVTAMEKLPAETELTLD